MKHRFTSENATSGSRNLIISIAIFIIIFICFWYAISSFSNKTKGEEIQTLESAMTRIITHCYAVEGSYPESLAYLKDTYGLTYDETKFFIDYQPLGSNILPDVTIIQKEDAQ